MTSNRSPAAKSVAGIVRPVINAKRVKPMLLTTKRLAEHIGISRTTLYRWQRAGLIPTAERRGRETVFSPVAVAIARNVAEGAR
jgi:predicted DNA-binding transcriptional regulator AlpA